MKPLLTPDEVDRLFRYTPGRAERLARAKKLPHIRLPGGEIRFEPEIINSVIVNGAQPAEGKVARAS